VSSDAVDAGVGVLERANEGTAIIGETERCKRVRISVKTEKILDLSGLFETCGAGDDVGGT
jgi:hypothetical protein